MTGIAWNSGSSTGASAALLLLLLLLLSELSVSITKGIADTFWVVLGSTGSDKVFWPTYEMERSVSSRGKWGVEVCRFS